MYAYINKNLQKIKVRNAIIAAVAGLLVLVSGYLLISSNAATQKTNCTVSDKLVNSCRAWLGAAANKYPDVTEGNYKGQILAHEKAIGRQVDIAHTYHPVGSNVLSSNDNYFIDRANTYLFTNWKPVKKWSDASGSNNSVNADIDKMAQSIKAVAPKKIFLTINHEAENDVTSGGTDCNVDYIGTAGTPKDYKAMWSNIRKRFDDAGAKNVVWVQDYMNYPKWDCLVDDLYPGNELVDWVMFNAYASGDGSLSDATKNIKHFTDLMAKHQSASKDFASKPWGIIEWNIHDSPANTSYKYYEDMKAIANNKTFPNIKAYVVFDSIGPEGNDNRIAYLKAPSAGVKYDAKKLDLYKQFANSPAFNSSTATPAPQPTPDTSAPSTPANVKVTAQSEASITLQWSAANDNVGVTGYRIMRGGKEVARDTTLQYADKNLTASTSYSYSVEAYDAAGNYSAPASITAKTSDAPDTQAPSAPAELAARTLDKQVNLSWKASTDNVAVKEYIVYRDDAQLAVVTATSFGDSTVAAGKTYKYTVASRDAKGNTSAKSAVVTATLPNQNTTQANQPGLAATYFANTNLSGTGILRTDTTVNFTWGAGAPVAGIPANNFSARWTGRITAPATGAYTFYTQADDGVRLWVNGTQIINDWETHSTREKSGTVQLAKGTSYNIQLEYFEASGNANVALLWSGPSQTKQVIPAAQLVTSSYGLNGAYFKDKEMTQLVASQLDAVVDFSWNGAPFGGLPEDNFSVRWSGQVIPSHTGTYTFSTVNNDGARLWVNNKQLINDWETHGSKENSGTIQLTAGTKYRIVMDYFDNTGHGVAQLLWSGPSQAKQIIPQTNLLDR